MNYTPQKLWPESLMEQGETTFAGTSAGSRGFIGFVRNPSFCLFVCKHRRPHAHAQAPPFKILDPPLGTAHNGLRSTILFLICPQIIEYTLTQQECQAAFSPSASSYFSWTKPALGEWHQQQPSPPLRWIWELHLLSQQWLHCLFLVRVMSSLTMCL